MSREYSENVLVQNSAGNLLQNILGWEVVLAYNSEKLGPDGTLGRTSYGEVLLTRYFRQALLRLNPWLTPNQLDEVQKKFTAHVFHRIPDADQRGKVFSAAGWHPGDGQAGG